MSQITEINAALDSLGEAATYDEVEFALRPYGKREIMSVLADRAAAAVNPVFGTYGAGDDLDLYVATTPQRLSVSKGTAAVPDATAGPLVKVERTLSIDSGDITGDGGEQCAAILGITSGLVANEGQAVGVYGAAKSVSTVAVPLGADDACGIYGIGRVTGAGTGTAIGGFFNGRRDTDTAQALGIEVHASNYGSVAGTWLTSGFQKSIGIWVNCSGNADSSAAIAVSNAFGRQFAVGLGFTSQLTGGLTGGVSGQSIRDDSTSATSIQINGTHATAAIAVASGSGSVFIGGLTQLTSPSRLEVQGSASASSDPLVLIGQTTGSFTHTIQIRNSVGLGKIAVGGATNSLITGTVAGDLIICQTTGSKFVHLGGSTSVIKVGNANTLGFFNATAVAKPTGVAVTAEGIHAALVSLGLIAA